MTSPELSRRDFLRVGATASVVLAGGSLFASLGGCSSPTTPATGFKVLRQSDIDLLKPLVPSVLASIRAQSDDVMRALGLLDELIYAAGDHTRENLFKLYDLLQLGAARWWLTGFWSAPAKLSDAERAQALQHWSAKDSGFALLAFRGLTQPLFMAWYADTDNVAVTGYPGPPQKVVG